MNSLFGIPSPDGKPWHITTGTQEMERLVHRIENYRFCQPVPEVSPPGGLTVVDSLTAAAKTLAKSAVSRQHNDWLNEARARLASLDGLVVWRQPGEVAIKDCTPYFLSLLGRRLADLVPESVPEPFLSELSVSLLYVLIATELAPRSGPDLLHDVSQAFWAGFFPLRYSGRHPTGSLEVFCPHDRPQHKAAGGRAGESTHAALVGDMFRALQRQFSQHPGFASADAVVSDAPLAWKALVAAADAHRAVAQHLAPLADSGESRAALARIAKRVTNIALMRKELVIHLRNAEGGEMRLRCGAPWAGEIVHLPKDLITLLRLHNGMILDEPAEAVELFRFNGKRFAVKVDEWYEPAAPPSDDPFSVAPLIAPLTDGQDIYVYHPTEPAADGSARLVRLSHEIGGPAKALVASDRGNDGAGGRFLRLVDERLAIS